ncbi:hypothetical protein HPB51_021342 [Rhipicephalus microplus]|uniref:Uncharacterized protein n=1 Tax=Rhipicephalus microplus TaxID=6941 RepID=A0A9J6F649_RHIMP|nr:hypothetical protein HPB51_021342 [Rhipicephalus microplus]
MRSEVQSIDESVERSESHGWLSHSIALHSKVADPDMRFLASDKPRLKPHTPDTNPAVTKAKADPHHPKVGFESLVNPKAQPPPRGNGLVGWALRMCVLMRSTCKNRKGLPARPTYYSPLYRGTPRLTPPSSETLSAILREIQKFLPVFVHFTAPRRSPHQGLIQHSFNVPLS